MIDISERKSLIAPTAILAAIYLYYFGIYKNYFPFGDDPAVLRGSAANPVTWFTLGFSRYFVVYPEWTTPFTDFLRPGVSLIVRIHQGLFGSHYWWYFASFYMAQALVCVVTVKIGKRLEISTPWLYMIGVLVAINPAFMAGGLESISFAFDVYCGLFTILTLYFVLRKNYILAGTVLTLALFTKESSLYAPLAAAITVYLLTRKKLLSVAMLAPLSVLAGVRKFVFSGSLHGVYAMPSQFRSTLRSVLQGIEIWPTGLFDVRAPRILIEHHSIHASQALIGAANLTLWAMLLILGIKLVRDSRRASQAPLIAVWIWTAGALSFGVLVGKDPRLGGSIYPLMLILCAVAYRRNKKLSLLAVSLLAGAFVWNAAHALSHRQPSLASPMHSLVIELQQLRDVPTVYILNAPYSYSDPDDIAALADTPSKLVVLSQVRGCNTSAVRTSSKLTAEGHDLHIYSTIPPCSQYEFTGVSLDTLAKGEIARGAFAEYSFPHEKSVYGLEDRDLITSVDVGRELNISFTPSGPYAVLYYDWSSGDFRRMM